MHSFIITGGSEEERKQYLEKRVQTLKIAPFDVIGVASDTPAIGIDEVRALEHRLTLKPSGGEYSVGIIRDAQNLTTQAQHALLKTLEEPPIHALIFLVTPNTSLLLPTIISRCQVIDFGTSSEYSKEEIEKCLQTITDLTSTSIGKRMKMIDEIAKTREDARMFLDKALYALHPSLQPKLLRNIMLGREQLAANANPKLVLDQLFW